MSSLQSTIKRTRCINPLFKNLTDPPYPWSPETTDTNPDALLELMQSSISLLKSSAFYCRFVSRLLDSNFQDSLGRVLATGPELQIVVYGIGSIESWETSRLHLALALLLRHDLGRPIASIEVFDPVLSAAECAVMEELGCVVLRYDEQDFRTAAVPTLFFLPHCANYLIDNVLGANWHPEKLNRIVVLGNRFTEYDRFARVSRAFSQYLELSSPHMLWVRNFVREATMEGDEIIELSGKEDDFRVSRAFRNLCWQFFELDDETNLSTLAISSHAMKHQKKKVMKFLKLFKKKTRSPDKVEIS